MQKIKYVLWGLLLGLTAWWLWADPLLSTPLGFFAVLILERLALML